MYKVNQNTAKPVDKDNHLLDSTRYFVKAILKRMETSYFNVIERDLGPDC
jgi:hypothetical protein